jgi:DNA polymerase III subunit gamma/tau
MSNLVLYRKYRPQKFAEVVSQEHVKTTLANAVINGRVGHAYLFTGPGEWVKPPWPGFYRGQ